MRKSKAEYQKKCKIKTVTFYTNKYDQTLYEYANSINFQKFVKKALEKSMLEIAIFGVEHGKSIQDN